MKTKKNRKVKQQRKALRKLLKKIAAPIKHAPRWIFEHGTASIADRWALTPQAKAGIEARQLVRPTLIERVPADPACQTVTISARRNGETIWSMTRQSGGNAFTTAAKYRFDGTLLKIEAELKAALKAIGHEIGDSRPKRLPLAKPSRSKA